MKKIKDFLFSTKLMAVLFLVFAGAMAVATFIENDFGTPTAQVMVFDAWWFEAIMIFFVINFIGNIFKFNLLRRKKWLTLMFHLSFILIIIGAGITRYISYEGLVIIKEGETVSQLLSRETYLQFHIDNDEVQWERDKKLKFSKVFPDFYNDFSINTVFQPDGVAEGKKVEVKYVNYINNVVSEFEKDETGEKHLHFVESTGGTRTDHYIKEGEVKAINRTTVGFNTHSLQGINIIEKEAGGFILETNEAGSYFRMRDQFQGEVFADSIQDLNLLSLYTLQGLQFVVPELAVNGVYESKSGDGNLDELIVDVSVDEETKRLHLKGGQYALEAPSFFSIGGLNFRLNYGSKLMDLPFGVKLNDFILEKYPGSESPKSYESEVTVVDGDNSFDFRIFMNNILDYKGFRLFQSSYNITPEYEETRLSVNHDFWGTWITYIGYFLLYLGLVLILFVPGSRFTDLSKMLDKVVAKKASLTIVFLFCSSFLFAQHSDFKIQIDSILKEKITTVDQADKFGRIIIQEESGRMEPFNTFSSLLLRKVSKKDTYNGYTADQVALSMVLHPRVWYAAPIIYMEKGHTQLRDLIGVESNAKYARLVDFFTEKGEYKLKELISEAHKEQIKSKYQKDLIKVDIRLNLLYAALDGRLFKFFPKPNDENNTWYSAYEIPNAGFTGIDSTVAASILDLYAIELENSKESGNFEQADKILNGIHKFQNQYGGDIMPTEKQVKFEILYNKYDIFKKLFIFFLLGSIFLLFMSLAQMLTNAKWIKYLVYFGVFLIIGMFLVDTLGLAIRWYISGHAPWSNAYESMIYIAWATMLFGLILGRKSPLTIAASAFVTSMMLMIAHWNWMDPTIGNLVPVLNSYWLMIHVAIIVASYGPFAVGAITGFISLVLMIFTTDKNKALMKLNIEELSIVTEMALTVGVVMLSIGNFLGGMWANESWGRYWGWDPKETWALISIMIYAFVIHSRLVPGLRGRWTFNVMATFAFTSILMTYLGVNHLLSGLHSYAAGEKAAIPNQIWISLGVATVVSILAYFKYKKHLND